jgi:hypothetical protein
MATHVEVESDPADAGAARADDVGAVLRLGASARHDDCGSDETASSSTCIPVLQFSFPSNLSLKVNLVKEYLHTDIPTLKYL